jgi:plasmid stability protein
MAQLLVRQLDDEVKEKLQRRARSHGRSTEEEVREILSNAVRSEGGTPVGLGTRLAAIFHGVGIDEEIPELRGHPFEPIEFDP